MRDHDPKNATFEADDATAGNAPESLRDLEVDESRYSRPSLRYLDVHDRPTLIP